MSKMVKFSGRFEGEFRDIFDFIAADSRIRAENFRDEIFERIYSLSDLPYRCRKSTKFQSQNVRDLIYKGYIVPYLIEGDEILILGIYKENIWDKI